MRCALQAGCVASLIVLAGCKPGESPTATVPDDGAITFQLGMVDGTRIPQATSTHLYVVGGQLRLHANGVFSEELVKSISQSTAFQLTATVDYSELASGFWTELPGGRYELRYADRRPIVADTASVLGTQLTKSCRVYWCGGPFMMTYNR